MRLSWREIVDFFISVTLPRNVKINLAGRPLTPARFFDLAYSEGRGSWIWKTGPAWTVIQVAAAFSPRLDLTFDTFQSFPLFFIGFPFFELVWLRWYSPFWNSATFRLNFFCSFARFRPLFASKTSSSLWTTSY